MAEWLANGRRPPRTEAESGPEADLDLTIDELIVRYMEFARGHYRQRDQATSEVSKNKDALRPLHEIFGSTQAREFGPKRFKAVRQRMIDAKLSRPGINRRVGRIVRMFKWAASEELAPSEIFHALRTVPGLLRGQTEASETVPIKPVPDA